MIHTVVWAESAAAELAAIWIASLDRPLITALVRDIDERLRVAPESAGESREAGFRILIAGSLAVTFEIRPADRIVTVPDKWVVPRG